MGKVFLSSTFTELQDHRQAAAEAIERAGHQCIRMEAFPASDRSIEEFCRDKVRECDWFVLLIGRFYGTRAPGLEISYTEREFQAALEPPSLNRLVFQVQPTGESLRNALEKYSGMLDWQVDKRRAFWLRAVQGVLPAEAANPEALKVSLLQSLLGSRERRPPRNELLLYTCDRGPQLDSFSETFDQHRGAPLLYILPGGDQQRHRSCVRRLLCYHINLRRREGIEEGGEHPHYEESAETPPYLEGKVEWPKLAPEDGPEVLRKWLGLGLFRSLKQGYPFRPEFRPAEFLDLSRRAAGGFVVLHQPLPWPRWDQRAHEVMRSWYLPFWDQIAQVEAPDKPQFLVFFEIEYPENAAPDQNTLRVELETAFEIPRRSGGPGARCFRLPPLTDVEAHELRSFADDYHKQLRPYLGAKRLETLFQVYPVPMADLEEKLDQLMENPLSGEPVKERAAHE